MQKSQKHVKKKRSKTEKAKERKGNQIQQMNKRMNTRRTEVTHHCKKGINWKVFFWYKSEGKLLFKNLKKVKVKKMSSWRRRWGNKRSNKKEVKKGWKKNKRFERDSVFFFKTAECQREEKKRRQKLIKEV